MKVFDKEVCGDLGAYGAHCVHTLTAGKRDMTKTEWDKTRTGYLCMTSEGFNDTETTIEQACVQMNCNYATRAEIKKAFARVRVVADKARKAAFRPTPARPLDVER